MESERQNIEEIQKKVELTIFVLGKKDARWAVRSISRLWRQCVHWKRSGDTWPGHRQAYPPGATTLPSAPSGPPQEHPASRERSHTICTATCKWWSTWQWAAAGQSWPKHCFNKTARTSELCSWTFTGKNGHVEKNNRFYSKLNNW